MNLKYAHTHTHTHMKGPIDIRNARVLLDLGELLPWECSLVEEKREREREREEREREREPFVY
jgi:hypothetical protein